MRCASPPPAAPWTALTALTAVHGRLWLRHSPWRPRCTCRGATSTCLWVVAAVFCADASVPDAPPSFGCRPVCHCCRYARRRWLLSQAHSKLVPPSPPHPQLPPLLAAELSRVFVAAPPYPSMVDRPSVVTYVADTSTVPQSVAAAWSQSEFVHDDYHAAQLVASSLCTSAVPLHVAPVQQPGRTPLPPATFDADDGADGTARKPQQQGGGGGVAAEAAGRMAVTRARFVRDYGHYECVACVLVSCVLVAVCLCWLHVPTLRSCWWCRLSHPRRTAYAGTVAASPVGRPLVRAMAATALSQPQTTTRVPCPASAPM